MQLFIDYFSEIDKDDLSSNNRIKTAFALLGIEMNEGKRPKLVGNVEYKMKHIRLQNRHLKFRKSKLDNPKHIRFDDDGNPVTFDGEEEVLLYPCIRTNKLTY